MGRVNLLTTLKEQVIELAEQKAREREKRLRQHLSSEESSLPVYHAGLLLLPLPGWTHLSMFYHNLSSILLNHIVSPEDKYSDKAHLPFLLFSAASYIWYLLHKGRDSESDVRKLAYVTSTKTCREL